MTARRPCNSTWLILNTRCDETRAPLKENAASSPGGRARMGLIREKTNYAFFAPHGSVRPRTAAPPAPYAPRALPPPGRSPLRSRRARRLAHCLPAACPAACVAGQRRFGRERSRRRSREAAEGCRSPRAPELAEPIITFATGPSAENDDLRQLARRRRRAASTLARRAGVESAVDH